NKERRTALWFVAAAVPLFAGGIYTAWTALPRVVGFLTMFTPEGTRNLITAEVSLKCVLQLLLAFGFAYLMPLFMLVLGTMGGVKGRTWLKGWRWAVIIILEIGRA